MTDLKPFIAVQRVRFPPGKAEPASRKLALQGWWMNPLCGPHQPPRPFSPNTIIWPKRRRMASRAGHLVERRVGFIVGTIIIEISHLPLVEFMITYD
jgi:hypothetical protein